MALSACRTPIAFPTAAPTASPAYTSAALHWSSVKDASDCSTSTKFTRGKSIAVRQPGHERPCNERKKNKEAVRSARAASRLLPHSSMLLCLFADKGQGYCVSRAM